MNTLTDRTRTLSLTKEVEENGKIPFLDCLVTRSNNRLRTKLQIDWDFTTCMYYVVYRLLSTTYFRMPVYQLRTNRRYWVVVNSYRHGTNELLLMESSKTNYGRTNNKRLFNSVWQQTDRNAPMTSRVFIANNITAYNWQTTHYIATLGQ